MAEQQETQGKTGAFYSTDGKPEYWWNGQCYGQIIPEELIDAELAALKKEKKERDGMATIQQKNKKFFRWEFRHLICGSQNSGTVHIPKKIVVDLQICGILQEITSAEYNVWYKVMLGEIRMDLLEVKTDFYKVVSGGETGDFLRNFRWNYDRKNVYCNSIVSGKKVCIERVVINYQKYGYFKAVNISQEAHHMWLRSCALGEMLKSLDRVDHKKGHSIVGNYSRQMVLRLDSVANFKFFLYLIEKNAAILSTKMFSIEY